MPTETPPEEKEAILSMIRQGKDIESIQRKSGVSASTIYRLARSQDLSIARKGQQGAQDSHREPWLRADREVIGSAKAFVRGHSRRVFGDIVASGQVLYERYQEEARHRGMTVDELAREALDFYLSEAEMVEYYKASIRERNQEVEQMRGKLSMMNVIMDMSMKLMLNGVSPNFQDLVVTAKAVMALQDEYDNRGETHGIRRENSGIGEFPGDEQDGVVAEISGPEHSTDGTEPGGNAPTEPERNGDGVPSDGPANDAEPYQG